MHETFSITRRLCALTTGLLAITVMVAALGCEGVPDQDRSMQQLPSLATETIKRVTPSIRSRLVDTYKELWPLMPVEQQHEKLPELLLDELPELRSFGIERVSVLIRDGEARVNELELVVSLLHDTNRAVRLSAATLLPEINVPNIAQLVAAHLSQEDDNQVASIEIQYFKDNPDDIAIDPVLVRLNTQLVREAAQALVVLLKDSNATEDNFPKWLAVVRKAKSRRNEPTLFTLEAILGSNEDRVRLIPKLDGDAEATRLAVANGFAASGFWEPLVVRSDDPSILSLAILALQQQGDLRAFKTLLTLRSTEESFEWDTGVLNILKSLDPRSFLLADDMLRLLDETDLRLDVLMKVWEQSESRSLAARKVIAKRTVLLLNSKGKENEALLLLEEFGDSITDEDLLSLRFSTAILASSWDSAADVRAEPQPWIAEWTTMLDRDPAAAAVIRQQIIQRFNESLTEAQRNTLGLEQTSVVTEETHLEPGVTP